MSASQEGAKGSVLVVEDNEQYITFLQNVLDSAEGIELDLSLCSCLSEAFEESPGNGYHAILLDLCLPDSEGIQTVEKMQECAGDTPIVILTGLDDTSLALNAIAECGVWNYLSKHDIAFEDLRDAVIDAVQEGWRRTGRA